MRYAALPCLIMILILITGIKSGAQSVRIEEYLSLTKVANTPDLIFSITEGEHYIALSSMQNNAIQLYNYVDSGTLTQEATIAVPSFAFSAINIDSLLYVADRDSGFIVYDINDTQNPNELDRLKLGTIETFSIHENYAYLYIRADSVITVLDISNPENLEVAVRSDVVRSTISMAFRPNYLFATTAHRNLLSIIDISDPANLTKMSEAFSGQQSNIRMIDAIILNGDYAYVTNNTSRYTVIFSSEMHVVDISDVNYPVEVNTYRWNEWQYVGKTGLIKVGNYLFVGAGENLLNVFDISDAANPVHLRTVSEFSGYMGDMIYRDNYLYIQTIEDGLTVLKLDIISSIDDDHSAEQSPRSFSLSQNYPNPFNPETRIAFTIPVAGPVKLIVYDVLGREVAKLIDRNISAGSHEVSWSANGIPSGVYFCKIISGELTETIKLTLLK